MLTEPKPKLFLSARSRFNLVLHNDVIDAMKTDYDGTFTVAAADTITLGEIAERLNLKPEFGAHDYDVGNITPSLTRSSWGTLELFRAML
jgi:hypothetical protein